jgi:hypothetical protein
MAGNPVDLVAAGMRATLQSHAEFHGEDFASLILTFAPDGSWCITGFKGGNQQPGSINTVRDVLADVVEMFDDVEGETIH